jgi:transcriptional regulator
VNPPLDRRVAFVKQSGCFRTSFAERRLMYIPAPFAESNLARLHDFIERNSFGLLVSQVDGSPFGSHLPLLLERTAGPHGTLIGHMARANPQWTHADGQIGLAIFSGPHAYVSPTWYESEQVVPTWNYVAVHAYGNLQVIDDASAVRTIVERTVGYYEQGMPHPWTFDGSTTFATRMLGQIVGFRLEIERIEGKWKLNQNHPVERRKKVIEVLERANDENSRAIAALMHETLDLKAQRETST